MVTKCVRTVITLGLETLYVPDVGAFEFRNGEAMIEAEQAKVLVEGGYVIAPGLPPAENKTRGRLVDIKPAPRDDEQ